MEDYDVEYEEFHEEKKRKPLKFREIHDDEFYRRKKKIKKKDKFRKKGASDSFAFGDRDSGQ